MSKLIIFPIRVESTSLHGKRLNPYILWYVFPHITTESYLYISVMDRIYDIRENVDTILPIKGIVWTKESPYFEIFYPVCVVTFSVTFILICTKLCCIYIYIYMFFILIWPMLALYIQYSPNKAINIISL